MAIVLAILKWIGIVAGGVLGLVLLFAVLIISVPVRYELSGNNRDVLCYQYRLSWLCRMVSVRKKMDSDEVWFRVFGIPVFRFAGGEPAEDDQRDKKSRRKNQKKSEKPGKHEKQQKPASMITSSGENSDKAKQTTAHSEKRKKKKAAGKRSDNRKKFFSFDVLSGIINFVRDTENRNAFRKIRKEICSLVRYLAPQKIRGCVVIGTGDPSSTGLMIGGISLLPFAYQDGLEITPDFDEKIFQADGMIKGRIRILYLLKLCIRLYRDEELKKLWDNIQKLKKEAA